MADYIERQAAIDALGERPMVWTEDNEYDLGCASQYDSDRLAIETVPSADVQPVRHGVWMEENRRPRSAMFYCSECHRTAYDIQPTRDKTWVKRCRYAYCPNCGARMDAVAEIRNK